MLSSGTWNDDTCSCTCSISKKQACLTPSQTFGGSPNEYNDARGQWGLSGTWDEDTCSCSCPQNMKLQSDGTCAQKWIVSTTTLDAIMSCGNAPKNIRNNAGACDNVSNISFKLCQAGSFTRVNQKDATQCSAHNHNITFDQKGTSHSSGKCSSVTTEEYDQNCFTSRQVVDDRPAIAGTGTAVSGDWQCTDGAFIGNGGVLSGYLAPEICALKAAGPGFTTISPTQYNNLSLQEKCSYYLRVGYHDQQGNIGTKGCILMDVDSLAQEHFNTYRSVPCAASNYIVFPEVCKNGCLTSSGKYCTASGNEDKTVHQCTADYTADLHDHLYSKNNKKTSVQLLTCVPDL
jgi:hypothetical protein